MEPSPLKPNDIDPVPVGPPSDSENSDKHEHVPASGAIYTQWGAIGGVVYRAY